MTCAQLTQVLPDDQCCNESNEDYKYGYIVVNGNWYEIGEGETRIGRDQSECNIVLEDESLSKIHAVIESEGAEDTFIYDVGSTNGTKIGKICLKPHCRYKINNNDEVILGNTQITFKIVRQKTISSITSLKTNISGKNENSKPSSLLSVDDRCVSNSERISIIFQNQSPSVFKEPLKNQEKKYYQSVNESICKDISSKESRCQLSDEKTRENHISNCDFCYDGDDIYNLSTQCVNLNEVLKSDTNNKVINNSSGLSGTSRLFLNDTSYSSTYNFPKDNVCRSKLSDLVNDSFNDNIFDVATQCESVNSSHNITNWNFKHKLQKQEELEELDEKKNKSRNISNSKGYFNVKGNSIGRNLELKAAECDSSVSHFLNDGEDEVLCELMNAQSPLLVTKTMIKTEQQILKCDNYEDDIFDVATQVFIDPSKSKAPDSAEGEICKKSMEVNCSGGVFSSVENVCSTNDVVTIKNEMKERCPSPGPSPQETITVTQNLRYLEFRSKSSDVSGIPFESKDLSNNGGKVNDNDECSPDIIQDEDELEYQKPTQIYNFDVFNRKPIAIVSEDDIPTQLFVRKTESTPRDLVSNERYDDGTSLHKCNDSSRKAMTLVSEDDIPTQLFVRKTESAHRDLVSNERYDDGTSLHKCNDSSRKAMTLVSEDDIPTQLFVRKTESTHRDLVSNERYDGISLRKCNDSSRKAMTLVSEDDIPTQLFVRKTEDTPHDLVSKENCCGITFSNVNVSSPKPMIFVSEDDILTQAFPENREKAVDNSGPTDNCGVSSPSNEIYSSTRSRRVSDDDVATQIFSRNRIKTEDDFVRMKTDKAFDERLNGSADAQKITLPVSNLTISSDSVDEIGSDLEVELPVNRLESTINNTITSISTLNKVSEGIVPKSPSSVSSDRTASDLDIIETGNITSVDDILATHAFPPWKMECKKNSDTCNEIKVLPDDNVQPETKETVNFCFEDLIPTQLFPTCSKPSRSTSESTDSDIEVVKCNIKIEKDEIHELFDDDNVGDVDDNSDASESLVKDIECHSQFVEDETRGKTVAETLERSKIYDSSKGGVTDTVPEGDKISERPCDRIGKSGLPKRDTSTSTDSDETDCEAELEMLKNSLGDGLIKSDVRAQCEKREDRDGKSILVAVESTVPSTGGKWKGAKPMSHARILKSDLNNLRISNTNSTVADESSLKRMSASREETVPKKRSKKISTSGESTKRNFPQTRSRTVRNGIAGKEDCDMPSKGENKNTIKKIPRNSTGSKVLVNKDYGNIFKKSSPKLMSAATRGVDNVGAVDGECSGRALRRRKAKDVNDAEGDRKTAMDTPSKVVFTGFESESHNQIIKRLGGERVNDVTIGHVLVTDRVRRTVKFLSAIALGIPIVSPKWLISSEMELRFLDPWDFLLEDEPSEVRWNFNLKSSIEKWRRRKLLAGFSVYATESTKPPVPELLSIVQCCGGKPLSSRPDVWPDKSIVLTCVDDINSWPLNRHRQVKVLHYEFLLSGVLKYSLDFRTYKLR